MTDELRIAYCITSYGSGEQLARLTRLVRSSEPGSPIVIHHDTHASTLDPNLLADVPGLHLIEPTELIVWGDMTLEAARWRVFRWILAELDVDWVVMLSEQDYPIAPSSTLRARLAEGRYDAFISATKMADVNPSLRQECRKRYYYQYRNLPSTGIEKRLPAAVQDRTWRARNLLLEAVNKVQPVVRFYSTPRALGLPTRVGFRAARPPFNDDFPCWYNDSWFTVSRKALERFLHYVDQHPEYGSYYERTVIPVESATATVICNDPELRVCDSSLHAIRWSDAVSGRPDILTTADLPFLMQSGACFARKFDLRFPEVLDELDRIVLATDKEIS